jgi:erythromycin esterase-like protein
MAEAKTARVAAEVVRGAARVLEGARADYDPLLKSIGESRFALLGEASHGTHEFYRERAEITKRLIVEKGYTAVAVEADWPDAYRVNRYVRDAFLVGFTTHRGAVTASSDWDEPGRRKRVRPALEGSYEALFHDAGHDRFMLDLREEGKARELLRLPRLERAIGVIYRPETERLSHYFHAQLAEQFDAVLHFDETTAVEPLEREPHWTAGDEPPETYPSGI